MSEYEVSTELLEAMKIAKACELASMLMQNALWTHTVERKLWLAVMEYLTYRGAEKIMAKDSTYFEGNA